MREILFRGKTVDGKWIDGFLFQEVGDCVVRWCITRTPLCANDYSEIMGDYAEVFPDTVGQYTGLTDKNGKKIFEGDIVESTSDLVNLRGEKSGKKITKFYEIVVTADDSSFTYGTREIGKTYISRTIYKEIAQRFYSVIGNIHDNPELLKGGEE